MNSQWEELNFPEIVFFQEGPGLRSYQFKNSGIKIVNVTNIVDGKLNLSNTNKYLDWNEFKTKYSHFAVEENDILMASSGATYGKTAIAKKNHLPLMMNTSVIRLHPKSEELLNTKFLHYFLQTQYFKNQINKLVTGSAQPNFGPTHLNRTRIIKPKSLLLQILISSKLDKLFTKLDAGIEYLKKTQILLKQYRQSVLKHAFEGKLTEKWREKHRNKIKSISSIIENIKKNQITNAISYTENNYANNRQIELPLGWNITKLGNISRKIQNTNPKKNSNEKFVYIDISSIENNEIVNPKILNKRDAPSRARQIVRNGDILFSTVRTYLKHIAVVPEKYDNQIASTGFCIIRPFEPINNKYIFYLILSTDFLNPLNSIQRGTSYPAVRDSDVFSRDVILPPILEQRRIVEILEYSFSIIDKNTRIIEYNLNYASNLRQSILKKTFEGKLVSQDPKDEPAEILLQRIKQEREMIIPIKKDKSKITKKSIANDSKQMRLM